MADKIAWQSATGRFSKIIAAAPMAGYIYDRSPYIQRAAGEHRRVAMFFHHSTTDTMVRPDGCCREKTAKCCCGISERSSRCLSVFEEFEHWLRWNRCGDSARFEDLKRDKIIEDENANKLVHAVCAHGTRETLGCDRMTSLCVHGDHTRHGQWSRDMPQAREVMLFFLKSLCLQQHGTFNAKTLECACDEETGFGGLFCITPRPQSQIKNITVDGESSWSSWSGFIAVLVIIASVALAFAVRRSGAGGRRSLKLMKYAKIKTDDDIESTEEILDAVH